MMQLEWDDALTNESEIGESLKKLGLNTNFEKMHSHSDNHADNAPNGHAHAHVNIPFLGGNAELYFAIISGLFWLAGLIFSFTSVPEITPLILFIIGAFFGGFFTFISSAKDLMHGRFEIDFLMLFAAIGAAILGKWEESALLLFLFSLGHALEHYAMKRARKSHCSTL